MTTLVINAGSSSVKFTLFEGNQLIVKAHGSIERIGMDGTCLNFTHEPYSSINQLCQTQDVQAAIKLITNFLLLNEKGNNHSAVKSADEIRLIGHRIVHGGDKINTPVFITDKTKNIIQEFSNLAPLHNPAALLGIQACETLFPKAKQVAVSDTAFHTTLPEHAYLYGIPFSLSRDEKIRKYGFHGINHKYVCNKAAHILKTPLSNLKIISCHLGNGSSITAVDKGKSIETSMGFTPMEGLIMGTRSGDIDPGILIYLSENKGMSMSEINILLNRQSGLLGMSGIGSSDVRDIEKAADCENHQAKTALKVFIHRIRKTIGAYAAVLSGVDALIFTGGIGENAHKIRERICKGFNGINTPGIDLDSKNNNLFDGRDKLISTPDSSVKVFVISANEEKEIALQALGVNQSTTP